MRLAPIAIAIVVVGVTTAKVIADVINVPADFPTIESVMDDAQHTDEIVVAAGVYPEAIDLLSKAITVRSVDGHQVRIIDASGLHTRAIRCVNGESSATMTIGFTLPGGTGSPDPGVPTASVGGGLFCVGSGPVISDCTSVGNDPISAVQPTPATTGPCPSTRWTSTTTVSPTS